QDLAENEGKVNDGDVSDRWEKKIKTASWFMKILWRRDFGRYLGIKSSKVYGILRLRYLTGKGHVHLLPYLVLGYGRLMYKLSLYPPTKDTEDMHTTKAFIMGEKLLYGQGKLVSDIDTETSDRLRELLGPS